MAKLAHRLQSRTSALSCEPLRAALLLRPFITCGDRVVARRSECAGAVRVAEAQHAFFFLRQQPYSQERRALAFTNVATLLAAFTLTVSPNDWAPPEPLLPLTLSLLGRDHQGATRHAPAGEASRERPRFTLLGPPLRGGVEGRAQILNEGPLTL